MALWAQRAQAAGVHFHISHCGTYNHWVLLVFKESQPGRVIYYDSCAGSPNNHIKARIKELFSSKVQISVDGKIRVVVAPSQRQSLGANLCLFFSIANADFFIDNRFSSGPLYDESQMRTHLEKCLRSNTAAPFPREREVREIEGLPKNIFI